jgi:mannan endo-1,4-beta-mannosidase
LHQSAKYPNTDLADYFVNIIDGDFVVGCNKFPIDGLNEWEVLEAGAGVPALTGSQLPTNIVPAQALRKVMDDAVSNGFTVLRAWAHGVTQQYATMTAPGKFNEALLRGLDYALVQARERGLKVILSFASNWTPAGGVDFYANATGVSHNDFFTNEATKSLYKSYIHAIVTRVNTISGVKYSEDPTIFAWDLLNEPVCRGCPKGTIATWVKEMAAYVKSLDTNHLLTVGEEGFYSTTQASIPFNPMYGQPGGTWAEEWGQDFVADHSDSNIDYASFHAWPDLWSCQAGCDALSVDFVQKWIDQHEKGRQKVDSDPLLASSE